MTITMQGDAPRSGLAGPSAVRWLAALFCALTALTLAPLAIWPIPPSWDLVNHWARLTLFHMAPGDPLAALYQVRLAPIPDLAIDLADLALSPLLSPESVMKLAWCAAIVLPAWGAWRVSKALNNGAPQPAILFVPVLSYNLVVTLGLVNFAIGMGLALIAFAAWLTVDRRRVGLRLAAFNAISVVLFFCHLAAFAALALLVALYEAKPHVHESRREWAKRLLISALHFAAGVVLWAFAPPIESHFSGPGSKIASLAAPMFNQTVEAGVLATLALVVALSAALMTRRVAFAPAMRWPLVGLLAFVALAPPTHGAADFIDARMAALLAYLVFASLQGPHAARARGWIAAVAVLVAVARVGAALPFWAAYNAEAGEFRQAFVAIPAGARALVVSPPPGRCPSLDAEDFARGLTGFVAIDRRALVSTLFTGLGMQPIAPRDPRLAEIPWTAPSLDWIARRVPDWQSLYDTVIALHVDCDWRPEQAGWAPAAEIPQATIYRRP
ncbi:MAG: hypothetical protein E7774_14960 [Bradyrhizobium sp.]|nr:MAG: hypothetical protein E7774_14960 [Bradyrhizobium sp.]